MHLGSRHLLLNAIVTTGMVETLEHFTWFRCTWLGSCKARYCVLMLDCDTDRSDSLASQTQTCTSE
jgi:hypothetical protein